MNLSDSEIVELESLLKQEKIDCLKDGLFTFNAKTSPNYVFLYNAINSQKWGFDSKGKAILLEGYIGCVLEGSSRSTKTWAGVDIIIWLCLYVETHCTINIYRETYNEFKTTLYDDFKRRLDDFGLPNKFHNAEEIKSFRIGENKINFLGDGKHGGGCDYAFFNEAMHINKKVFDQVTMRCRKFWWMDYNPSYTDHWVFDSVIPIKQVGFLRTTFRDNPFISFSEKNKILSYEPWEPGSYDIIDSQIIYNGKLVDDKNQPPPHILNIEQGTADEFMWKVYGLGLRGAMKGVIFNNVQYVNEFPDIGYHYGNDFGFTNDPNVTVKYAEDDNNIWVEPLCYSPIDNPDDIDRYWHEMELDRSLPITCDSSDKYTGENKGTVEMVRGLEELGWRVSKVKKTKSIMYWLTSMKKKKIHIIKNQFYREVKKEQENYVFKEINGIPINQPIDKYNHFWDAARYAHIAHNETEYEIYM